MSMIRRVLKVNKLAYSSAGKIGDKIIDRLIVMMVEPSTNQVHETPCDCIINTLSIPHNEAIINSRFFGLIFNNLSKNRLRRIPYVNDAILSPVISRRLLLSSKTEAININANAQKTLIALDSLILSSTSKISLSVEEDNELIDELSVDIAAERTPTSSIPLIPIGR
jgi:hypothetical protein